eukprot:3214021-Pyramimonas_sp.AAC.1
MGPARHAGNPSGSPETCNCHFWAPLAWVWRKSQAGASSVSELQGSLRRELPSLWGPALHVGNPSGSSET